jgi:WD40 repeat protein
MFCWLIALAASPDAGPLASAATEAPHPSQAATPADEAEIGRLIEQLGGASYAEREQAQQRLEAIGLPALGPLKKATESDNPEIRLRAWLLANAIEKRRWQVRVFEGHGGVVWAVAFSPDGRLALTGGGSKFVRGPPARRVQDDFINVGWEAGSDFAIRVWDLAAGKELRRLEGHTKAVSSLSLSSDGRTAASGGFDDTVRLWEISTGKELKQFRGHTGGVDAVALTPDGRRIVSGSRDATLRVWDAKTGQELKKLIAGPGPGGGAWVRAVALSPDGRLVASAGSNPVIRLWDLEAGKELRQLRGHGSTVMAVAFSDGRARWPGRGRRLVAGR